MTQKIFRVKSEKYGKKGVLLPRALEFLRKVPYTQVIEDQRGDRIQVRVELEARHLKKMVYEIDRISSENAALTKKVEEQGELLKHYFELISPQDLEEMRNELAACKRERKIACDERDVAMHSASHMNIELPRIQELFIEAYNITEEGSPFRSFFNQKIRHHLIWPPLQGGAPGLGR
jgi:paraquat-inducible protein B